MAGDNFMRFVGLSDVILDTFPVGGGRSSLEIFSVSTPIVVLYPRTPILQLTTGMYKMMWNEESFNKYGLVTYNMNDYCTIAVNVAKNNTLQNIIRKDIITNNHKLYIDGNDVVLEWLKLLQYIHQEPRPHYTSNSIYKEALTVE